MFAHLLVPVDGSDAALKAGEFSLTLADRQTRITFLHIVEPNQLYALSDDRTTARDALAGLVERCRALGLRAHAVVVDGTPADTIVRYAAQAQADLIVMSTHGRSGIMRALMGSVAEGVLRNTTLPVLFAPTRPRPHPPQPGKPLEQIVVAE